MSIKSMSHIGLLFFSLLVTGCASNALKSNFDPAFDEKIQSDLLSAWLQCTPADSVRVGSSASPDSFEYLLRSGGIGVVPSTLTDVDEVTFVMTTLSQQGDGFEVEGRIDHPDCSVARFYRVSGLLLTPTSPYAVRQ